MNPDRVSCPYTTEPTEQSAALPVSLRWEPREKTCKPTSFTNTNPAISPPPSLVRVRCFLSTHALLVWYVRKRTVRSKSPDDVDAIRVKCLCLIHQDKYDKV